MRSSSRAQNGEAWRTWHTEDVPLRLGVSSCLLGETVRFDRGHARSRYVTDVLSTWVEWASVCPEVEAGMGVPRPTVRLVEVDEEERMLAPSTGQDFTEAMRVTSQRLLEETGDLDGFVLKKNSPSCGLERIRVYLPNGHLRHKHGRGHFARALCARWPELPVEEDGRLNDAPIRENFIERVFARNRWRALLQSRPTRQRLVAFHTAHKLLLLAHNEAGYRRLGRLVASFGSRPDGEVLEAYGMEFHAVLARQATTRRHTNVLQHALGHLKKILAPRAKHELLTAIEDYHEGLLPLVVPVTLLRYAIAAHEIAYLSGQLYFEPHPKELMLRNHV